MRHSSEEPDLTPQEAFISLAFCFDQNLQNLSKNPTPADIGAALKVLPMLETLKQRILKDIKDQPVSLHTSPDALRKQARINQMLSLLAMKCTLQVNHLRDLRRQMEVTPADCPKLKRRKRRQLLQSDASDTTNVAQKYKQHFSMFGNKKNQNSGRVQKAPRRSARLRARAAS